jgi:phosphatidate cytidylyltransferase
MALDRNLTLRVASGVVGLPILAAVVLWGGPHGFALLCSIVAAVALAEYARLTLAGRPAAERAALVVIGLGLAAALYLRPTLGPIWAMIAVVLVATAALARTGDSAAAFGRLAAGAFGVFYAGGLVVALPLVHRDVAAGPLWVLSALGVTFAGDTGAYFVGRTWGRRKLAPAISPGKTVEGAAGGLLAAVLFMFVARASFFPALAARDCILVGLAAGVLGPIGDLTESLLKRSAGVKDSGRFIPGHGGMLDRIDALLFVGAYVYLHVTLIH